MSPSRPRGMIVTFPSTTKWLSTTRSVSQKPSISLKNSPWVLDDAPGLGQRGHGKYECSQQRCCPRKSPHRYYLLPRNGYEGAARLQSGPGHQAAAFCHRSIRRSSTSPRTRSPPSSRRGGIGSATGLDTALRRPTRWHQSRQASGSNSSSPGTRLGSRREATAQLERRPRTRARAPGHRDPRARQRHDDPDHLELHRRATRVRRREYRHALRPSVRPRGGCISLPRRDRPRTDGGAARTVGTNATSTPR